MTIGTYWFLKYSSQEQLFSDPDNSFVTAFLTDAGMTNAIGVMKVCIDKNKK